MMDLLVMVAFFTDKILFKKNHRLFSLDSPAYNLFARLKMS